MTYSEIFAEAMKLPDDQIIKLLEELSLIVGVVGVDKNETDQERRERHQRGDYTLREKISIEAEKNFNPFME